MYALLIEHSAINLSKMNTQICDFRGSRSAVFSFLPKRFTGVQSDRSRVEKHKISAMDCWA